MAGTTGAVFYLKPRALGALTVNGKTGAVIGIPVRALSGIYSQSGVTASRNRRNLKNTLPSIQVPIGYVVVNGQRLPVQIDTTWYAFNRYLVFDFLGGPGAPTFLDVVQTVATGQVQNAAVAATTDALTQGFMANGQAVAAIKQIVQNVSMPGATQIPKVVLEIPETATLRNTYSPNSEVP